MRNIFLVYYTVVFVCAGVAFANDGDYGTPEKFTHVGEHDYIVEGEDATKDEFPWQVMLTYRGRFRCGGSILSPTLVMTAAHCHGGGGARFYEIRAGDYDLTSNEGTEQVVSVRRWLVHKQWNRRYLLNDIALLKLRSPLTFTASVQPLNLSDTAFDMAALSSTNCVTSGFGQSNQDPDVLPTILQKLNVTVLSNADCNSALAPFGFAGAVRETNVCTMQDSASSGSCYGDSGGPVGCYDDQGSYRQLGITSWGPSRTCGNGPTVFTRVSAYLSWINKYL